MSFEARSGDLIILGCGGHARSVADVAIGRGYKNIVFLDPQAAENETLLGYPVLKEFTTSEPSRWCAFPGSGNGKVRQKQVQAISESGWNLVSLVAASANLSPTSFIDQAVFVGHQAHVGPMARIGRGSIINSGAVVDHESVVGDWAHVSVNATMAGRCHLGDFSMLGAGAVMIDGMLVGGDATIGAGAVVAKCIDLPGVYVGVPAKRMLPTT